MVTTLYPPELKICAFSIQSKDNSLVNAIYLKSQYTRRKPIYPCTMDLIPDSEPGSALCSTNPTYQGWLLIFWILGLVTMVCAVIVAVMFFVHKFQISQKIKHGWKTQKAKWGVKKREAEERRRRLEGKQTLVLILP